MSNTTAAATAQPITPAPAPVSSEQERAATVLMAGNSEITDDILQNLSSIPPGQLAQVVSAAKAKQAGVASTEKVGEAGKTAAEAGTKTPEEIAAETQAAEAAALEAAATETDNGTKTPAEGGKTQEELDAEAAEAGTKTPEEIAAEAAALKAAEEGEDDPKRIRLHLEKMTPLGRKVALLMRAGMDPDKALVEAKAQLGIKDGATSKPATATPTVEQESVKAAETELVTARKELAKANSTFDETVIDKAFERYEAATAKVFEAKESAKAAVSHQSKVDASINRSIQEWPDAQSFEKPLGELVYSRLSRIYADANHPLNGDPDAPFKVTEMVAKELGIAGKSASTAAKPAVPSTPASKAASSAPPPRAKPAVPVPGSARSSAKVPDKAAAGLAKIKELAGDDYELVSQLAPATA
jgi:nicotinate-nucleotide--dimethylbenzimidazole phosphoribosyltransferase